MLRNCWFLILMLFNLAVVAQDGMQNIRGRVTDSESNQPIPGANIAFIEDSLVRFGTTTDSEGRFLLESLSPGRYTLQFSFIGFQSLTQGNIEVQSGRETVLTIALEETAFEIATFEVTASEGRQAANEMALISARQFNVLETERYAGSRGEPSRMASNFAGVQGADDSRNDIIIRGNSPQAILWRLEGIPISNPNHFNIPGTAGGSVSVLNNKTLANSDFFTGAFPAEFGNATAGVFDLNLRNGNDQNHEFTGQFGFLGTELMVEGPLSRDKNASYMAAYRYSTLALFGALGIDIGTTAIPRYQDAAFHIHLPGKGASSFSVFGIGGWSKIDILISDQEEPDRNLYGSNDRDQYFGSQMGLLGVSHTLSLSEKTYLKTVVAVNHSKVTAQHDLVFRQLNSENKYVVDSLRPILDYSFIENKTAFHSFIHSKRSARKSFRAGIVGEVFFFNYQDSALIIDSAESDFGQWRKRWDSEAQALLLQPYVQWKLKPAQNWVVTAGLHAQYYTLSQSLSPVEPRLAARYQLPGNQSLNLGVGLHSQLQQNYLYFYSDQTNANGDLALYNKNMDFTKAFHSILGYETMLARNLNMKVEGYFQWIYDIPVTSLSSSFSLANSGSGFSRFFPDTLINEGVQRNFGIELTLEKFFARSYYLLFTGSLFDSRYQGSDGVWRNTDFNGNYAVNFLGAKEFKLGPRSRITAGTKVTVVGGRWYGPADIELSNQQRELIEVDSSRNSLQFPAYFRLDLKLNYVLNTKRITHEVGIDLVNVLNTQNVLSLTYAPDESNTPETAIRREYQLGRLPLFYYRIRF